jgi:anti-sigma-K factor RskA
MTHDPTNDGTRDLLGVYALGALGDDERDAVERMLLEDADARTELHRLEHAVAWMAHASPRPSEAAWQAVAAAMQRDLAGTEVDPSAPDAAAPVHLAERRPRVDHRRRVAAIAVAALAVAALVLAVLVVGRPGGSSARDTVALRDDRGRTVVLMRLVSPDRGEVVRADLSPTGRGREFQLWSIPGPGAPVRSAALLGRTVRAGRRVPVPRGTRRLAISVEPTGGSAAPTTTPVATGALR